MGPSVHTPLAPWFKLFLSHIVYFVCDGFSSVGFTTYWLGVKSLCHGYGVKRWRHLRMRVPLRGCACTGACAPAHTRYNV